MDLLRAGDHIELIDEQDVDNAANQAHTDIKLHLTEVSRGTIAAKEAARSTEPSHFAINLEHAGDVVAKNLQVLAEEQADKNWHLSSEGWAERIDLHARSSRT